MKAILFLAVLVIAAQSNPITELYRGFISNLPMETELKNSIMNDGLECLHQTEGVLKWAVRLIQQDLLKGRNFLEAIKEILYTEELIMHRIAPQCVMTSQRIGRFLQENSGIHRIFELGLTDPQVKIIHAEIYQTLARVVEDLVYNRGFAAGEKLATSFKLAFYMIIPELPVIEVDYSDPAPLDEEKFYNEFIATFFRELGASEAQVNGYVSCSKAVVPVLGKVFSNPILHRGQFLPAMTAFLDGSLEIIDTLQKCEKIDFNPVKKVIGLFMRNPVEFLVKLGTNSLFQRVDIAKAEYAVLDHGLRRDYTNTGKDLVKMVKAYLKDIVF